MEDMPVRRHGGGTTPASPERRALLLASGLRHGPSPASGLFPSCQAWHMADAVAALQMVSNKIRVAHAEFMLAAAARVPPLVQEDESSVPAAVSVLLEDIKFEAAAAQQQKSSTGLQRFQRAVHKVMMARRFHAAACKVPPVWSGSCAAARYRGDDGHVALWCAGWYFHHQRASARSAGGDGSHGLQRQAAGRSRLPESRDAGACPCLCWFSQGRLMRRSDGAACRLAMCCGWSTGGLWTTSRSVA